MVFETIFIRLQFLRRNHFEILSIASSNSSNKSQHLIDSLAQQQNRIGKFEKLVQFTQVESRDIFYTVRKLEVSSFKCHKQHSILTSEQRVMII